MSNLRLINETTATSVASISVTDVFSADFDIYKIIVKNVDVDATNARGQIRFINSSGSVVTASNYDYAVLSIRSFAAFAERRATNQTQFDYLLQAAAGTTDGGGNVIYVFNPFSSSTYTFAKYQSSQIAFSGSAYQQGQKGIGVLRVVGQMTGINILCTSTFDTVDVSVYGLRVDS